MSASGHSGPLVYCFVQDLKDQNDELTAELEQIRVQGVPLRKPSESSSPERGSHPPAREGSIMSNYIRPTIVKRALGSPYGTLSTLCTSLHEQ